MQEIANHLDSVISGLDTLFMKLPGGIDRWFTEPTAIRRANKGLLTPEDLLTEYGMEALMKIDPAISNRYIRATLDERPFSPSARSFMRELQSMPRAPKRKPLFENAVAWISSVAFAIQDDKNNAFGLSNDSITYFFKNFPYRLALGGLFVALHTDIQRRGAEVSRTLESDSIVTLNAGTEPNGRGSWNGSSEWDDVMEGSFRRCIYTVECKLVNPVAEGAIQSLEAIIDQYPTLAGLVNADIQRKQSQPQRTMTTHEQVTDSTPIRKWPKGVRINVREEHDGR